MATLVSTRERPASLDFVWPPPQEELDALQVIELGRATPSAPMTVARRSAEPAPRAAKQSEPARPKPALATLHARLPWLASTAALMLLAMTVGVLLGARDARRSMADNYSRLRESVVGVREYVEHVGTTPASAPATARPTTRAASPRPRVGAIAPLPSNVPASSAAANAAARNEPAPTIASIDVAPLPVHTLASTTSTDAKVESEAPSTAGVDSDIRDVALTSRGEGGIREDGARTRADVMRRDTPVPEAAPLTAIPSAVGALPSSIAPPIAPSIAAPVASPVASASRRAEAPAAVVVAAATDETRVTQVLARYQHAYETLDARAAAALWPSVDVAALTRAFSGLKSQALTFDRCDVAIDADGSRATVACAGSTTVVRQVGRATPVTQSLNWMFDLRRGGDSAFVIENVRTTR